MAFVEEMVLEKDWKKYNSFALKYENCTLKADDFTNWYVDKESGIYFLFLGGGALERPQVYALMWNDKKVIIYVEEKTTNSEVYWSIFKIKADKELEIYKDEIIEKIREVAKIVHSKRRLVITQIVDIIFVSEDELDG